MKKKITITILLIALIILSFVMGKHYNINQHTFQNVAIYYSNNEESYLIDEDGVRYDVDFDCPNDTTIFVTYNNQNTVTRLDDIPIDFEIIK